MQKPMILKGFRDINPELCILRNKLMNTVNSVASLHGFQEIATPALEYSETLIGQGSQETDKQIYSFTDHGSRDVALRFDLTIPFTRYVAANQGTLVFPFKKLQTGLVWRGEKPQKGRYREFYQSDIDIIGVDSIAADIEIMQTLAKMLLGIFQDFKNEEIVVQVGNRTILAALIKNSFGEIDAELLDKVFIALDKMDKIGCGAVTELLIKLLYENNISTVNAVSFMQLVTQQDENCVSDLGVIKNLSIDSSFVQEVCRYEACIEYLNKIYKNDNISFNASLSLARGLGYYTGIVFETTIKSLSEFGSISSGGRYDKLLSRFSSRDLAGVGGSIGVDRILAVLTHLYASNSSNTGVTTQQNSVYVAYIGEENLGYSFDLVNTLRNKGFKSHIAMQKKLAQQFKHADRLHCKYVITIGSEEQQSNTYSIKNLKTGSESKKIDQIALLKLLD